MDEEFLELMSLLCMGEHVEILIDMSVISLRIFFLFI